MGGLNPMLSKKTNITNFNTSGCHFGDSLIRKQ